MILHMYCVCTQPRLNDSTACGYARRGVAAPLLCAPRGHPPPPHEYLIPHHETFSNTIQTPYSSTKS